MLKKEIAKELERIIKQEERRISNTLKENEEVIFFPTKVSYTDKGLIERISVLNIKNYMSVNKEFTKDFCSVCGNFVDSEIFASDKKGQKMHIECAINKI